MCGVGGGRCQGRGRVWVCSVSCCTGGCRFWGAGEGSAANAFESERSQFWGRVGVAGNPCKWTQLCWLPQPVLGQSVAFELPVSPDSRMLHVCLLLLVCVVCPQARQVLQC